MAYITKFNFRRITKQVDENLISDINDKYYKQPIAFLSDREIKQLLVYKMLLENTGEFIKNYYQKVKDTNSFIFEHSPAYHNDVNCERLRSDFHGIKIPEAVKENDQVNEFKAWCKQHFDLFEKDIEAFKARCAAKFRLSQNDFENIYAENSGVETKENLDLEEIERKIDELIADGMAFYNSSVSNNEIISNFRNKMFLYLPKYDIKFNPTAYPGGYIKKILEKQYKSYNEPIVPLLQEWLKVSLNPELEFKGDLLEQLNFKPCQTCYDEFYGVEINVDDLIL